MGLVVACAFFGSAAVAGYVVSPVTAAGVSSFYVNCSNGSDASPGTSGAPWKSLTKASAATLLPGDQLLLARGCVWDGQRLSVPWNGTAGAPITISAYGTGARPIVKNGGNYNVKITGSYVVLDGLDSENTPRQLDPCGQPIGEYYGFNFGGGAHDNTLINSVSSGSTAGVHLGSTSRATRVISNVFTGNNVLESFGTNNDLGAWGVNIISDDNEIAYNVFANNAAVCPNGKTSSNSLEIFAGSNNNIHDNNSFNDRVFTELGSSATSKAANNTFANNLFVTGRPDSRFIVTRGALDTSYGPVPGTTVVGNTTFQTGTGSQAVVCSLGCGGDILSLSSNVMWAEEKVMYADAPFSLGRNLIWNSAGQPFAQVKGGSLSSLLVTNPKFADPASNNFAATAAPDLGVQRASSPTATPIPVPPPVPPVSKQRILDTRPYPLQVGYTGGKPSAGNTVTVQVAGRGGVPATGVAAVTMNVILTESTGSGFVTAWPSGQAQPTASNINVEGVGATISTLVTVPMGADGKVNLFTNAGGHLVADVAGWLPTGTFVASNPTRILDTRPGPQQLQYSGDRPGAGSVVDVQVAGVGPVPIKGVSAVVLSLVATEAAGPGYITIWPSGTSRPLASAVNALSAGSTASNQVTVPLGADGKVSIFTQSGAHLVADVAGYYVAGHGFNALMPTRILDTRRGSGQMAYAGPKPAGGQTLSLPVLGRAGVPNSGVGYVILNLTATEATAPGYVSAWPGGTPQPTTSVMNLSQAGQTRANAVFAPVGADGTIQLFSQSGADLVADVTGWLAS